MTIKKINTVNPSNYKTLTPFKKWLEYQINTWGVNNFPFLENDFDQLTNYGMMMKLMKSMNVVIYNQNLVEEDVKKLYQVFNELVKYFDNLDLQDEVDKKLDSMVQDGTLDNLLKNILNFVDGSLVLNIDYRDGNDFIKNVTNESLLPKGGLQGFTTTENSYIVARKVEKSIDDYDDTMVYLQEISKSTKSIIKESYLQLYHANSIAYNKDDKEIYITATNYTDSSNVYHEINDIIVVDYDTFTIKNIITPPTEITNSNRIRSVSYDNKNKVLALADEFDVFIMNDFTSVKNHIVLDTDFTAPKQNLFSNNQTIQNVVLYNNKIYTCRYNSNGINVYDIEGKLLNNYYSFDYDIPFQMGELEAISIEDDNVYLASYQISSTGNSNKCQSYDITIFKTNLHFNGYKNYYYSYNITNRISVYVDSTTNNHLQVGFSNYPFKTISQAIAFVETIDKKVSVNINLVGSNKNYGFLTSKSNNSFRLLGNNNIINAINLDNVNAYIEKIKVDATTLVNMSYDSNILFNNNCHLYIKNLTLINNNSQKENGISIRSSYVNMETTKIDNYINGFNLNEYSDVNLTGLTCTNCTNRFKATSYTVKLNHANNEDIYNNCNLTDGYLPKVFKNQSVDATFENNVLTFKNRIDSGLTFNITFRLDIDSSTYFISDNIFYTQDYYHEIRKTNKTFKIYIHCTNTSSGVRTFTFTIIEVDNTTQEQTVLTQNTDYTIIVSSMRAIH